MRFVDVGSVGLIFLQYDVLSISSLSLFPLNSTFDADVGSVDSISTGPDFLLDDVLVSLSLHPFEEEYDLLQPTTRKRKLLDKQRKGKARSKQFGSVEIPQEAFTGVLKINKDK